MKKVYFIISLVILMSGKMVGQNNRFIELAEATIANFKCSVNQLNFKYYGLSSADALERLRVGEVVIHYGVKLTDLQEYNEDTDPNSIIQEMGYVTVALVNPENKQIESFVLLNEQNEKYASTGIGQAPYALIYLQTIARMEMRPKARLVRIPGLNLAYIAVEGDEGLNLISIADVKQRGAAPRPAVEIFTELAKQVSKGEDVPR